MTVANYNANQLWLQLVKNQHKLNVLVVALLLIFLLAYAAELTWRLYPQPETNHQSSAVITQSNATSSNNSRLNLADIKKLNLFGDLSAKPEVEKVVTEAPVTRLNLTLTGVVASSVEAQGAAIIENRGQQQTYGIGEKIEGTNASLQEVHADRVIIKNGVNHETLMLDGVDYTKVSSAQVAQKSSVFKSSDENSPQSPSQSDEQRRTLSKAAIQATLDLQNQPANFTDYISISPHRPDGELAGYRVSPGKNPTLFTSAGLEAGDVITELNGLDLSDMQQSLEAMNMLKELQSLQMTVLRNDDLLTIFLDLPQGEEEF
ncbi:type II secretion system protein GspC [Paraglaciecola aquimarina]|uniref:Type II secretion system protein GspC n=1 Tax=Paraglaciecola algarum TaxID=3050085 RepID=A0ABS9D4Q6_9ALTE|nr:type II secretion system protein GspC [Paraglaciecola sp. G1-23]MCF2947415.1 type II secretion system protein GspC [Paraglaciecola sp. G1-23]